MPAVALLQKPVEVCSIDECGRPVEAAGLCSGHRKRKTEGRPLNTPLQERPKTNWGRLKRSIDEYYETLESPAADENPKAVQERAESRLRRAIYRYVFTPAGELRISFYDGQKHQPR